MRVALIRILLVSFLWTISPWHAAAHAESQAGAHHPHHDALHTAADLADESSDTVDVDPVEPDPLTLSGSSGDAGCCALGPCSGLVCAHVQITNRSNAAWRPPSARRPHHVDVTPPTRPPTSPHAF